MEICRIVRVEVARENFGRVMFLVSRVTDAASEVEVLMRPADILRWARVFSSDDWIRLPSAEGTTRSSISMVCSHPSPKY